MVLVPFCSGCSLVFLHYDSRLFHSALPRKQTSGRHVDIVTILPNANAGPLLKGKKKKKKLVNIASLSFPLSFSPQAVDTV